MKLYSHVLKENDKIVKEQTVTEHCRASAEYAQHALAATGIGDAGYLAGLLHDMGKMKQEFQDYLLEGKGVRGSVNHTFAGCRFLLCRFRDEQTASCEKLTAELLAFAVGAHHGLFDCVDREGASGFRHRLEKENIGYKESCDNFFKQCADPDELKRLFDSANAQLTPVYEKLGELAGESNEEFAFYLGLLARLLLSAVIEGDRCDTAEFMTGVKAAPEPENYSELWRSRRSFLENKLKEFEKDEPIQRARAEISQKCCDFGKRQGGIIRLNVPTGGGKTLSSLRFALSHAEKWGKRRLVFTSPLLTILEQNAKVIREALGDDSIVLEHHSNVVEPDDTNELDLRELAVESWHSPVIITTLVQFLNTLFLGKTSAVRRFQSLCDSVIVIDEVQTVPSKMLSLFHLAINFLADVCGATVVLCSATQPCLERVAHPIRPAPPQMIPFEERLWQPFRRTRILDGGRTTLEDAVKFIRGEMEQVNSLLVVCNKKKEAEYLLKELEGAADVCCHLSASMCPAHRRDTLERLYKALCPENAKTCLCVATQVIEAGVDISFQRVIRFTAGMDSVVQSAGRCNRNAEGGIAPVYVVTLLDEDLSRLEEICKAKDATLSLLSAYERDPEGFECDLSSDAAINYYYNKLYGAMKCGAQDFPLAKEKVSLLTLLSDNRNYWKETSGSFLLNQAFRMAGDAFTVFDNDAHDVVVPYGDGQALIEELAAHSTEDIAFLKDWASRAKPYTVSLYSYQLKALEDVIWEHGGVKALPPEYYDEQTGFTMEPGQFDLWEE